MLFSTDEEDKVLSLSITAGKVVLSSIFLSLLLSSVLLLTAEDVVEKGIAHLQLSIITPRLHSDGGEEKEK